MCFIISYGSPIPSPSFKHVKPCESAGHTEADALESATAQSTHSSDSCTVVKCADDDVEMALLQEIARTETSRNEVIDVSTHSTTTPSYPSSYTPFTLSFSNPGYGYMPYRRKHSSPYLQYWTLQCVILQYEQLCMVDEMCLMTSGHLGDCGERLRVRC